MIKFENVCKNDDSLVAPWHATHRGEVGLHGKVAVSALPRGHLVAIDRVHVDVHRHEVIATFCAMSEALVYEELGVDEFSLEPSLHIGDSQDDGIDLFFGDGLNERVFGVDWIFHDSPRRCPVCPDLGIFLAYVVLSTLTRRPLL
ncbi:unannotated protein [freshwater metagenome]|uniref:Unannotated protein n=1 Tax=freshwater metagenome TaxID=449393 RepID=A0A6J7V318_9ZZZZ